MVFNRGWSLIVFARLAMNNAAGLSRFDWNFTTVPPALEQGWRAAAMVAEERRAGGVQPAKQTSFRLKVG